MLAVISDVLSYQQVIRKFRKFKISGRVIWQNTGNTGARKNSHV